MLFFYNTTKETMPQQVTRQRLRKEERENNRGTRNTLKSMDRFGVSYCELFQQKKNPVALAKVQENFTRYEKAKSNSSEKKNSKAPKKRKMITFEFNASKAIVTPVTFDYRGNADDYGGNADDSEEDDGGDSDPDQPPRHYHLTPSSKNSPSIKQNSYSSRGASPRAVALCSEVSEHD